MMSRLRRTVLVAGMLLACGPLGAAPGAAAGPLAAPYPRSKVVTGISWDASTYRFGGVGGDLWATTSGADGKVYTTWGDGTVACPVRVSFGVASVAGGPGTTLVRAGCGTAGDKADKLISLLAVDSNLYAIAYLQLLKGASATAVWRSADRGATWRRPSWTFPQSELSPAAFANFGPGYAGARDTFVYVIAQRASEPTALYMARAPKDRLQVKEAYEYLTGPVASPGWSQSPAAATPVFVDPNGVDTPDLVYDAGIGRFLLTAAHGREGSDGGRVGVFEGPEPWGPWWTIDYRDGWLGIKPAGSSQLGQRFPSVWMADGGRTLWSVFSCWSRTKKTTGVEACGKYNDRYNLMKASLTLAPSRQGRHAG